MGMRVLIVEDEAVIALCIGMTLQEAGYEVVGPVMRMEECLKLAERQMPDLALVDINLVNSGSGIDVARVLLERWKVMSIFVSAQHLEAQKNMDVAIGCLKKPFALKSLVETIEVAKLLQQGKRPHRMPDGLDLYVEDAGRYVH
jgi:DNA-binding response OmpR family regulator